MEDTSERLPAADSLPSAGLTARCVRGGDAVAALAKDWDSLTARATAAVPFVARAYVQPWIDAGRARGTPAAATVWQGAQLVGLFVVAVRSRLGVRIAEPAATGSPGYFGVMVDPACPGAAARLAEACADGRLFHALGIEDFSSLDAATEEFLGELSRRGFSVARAHRNPCRRIALGRTYDQYLLDTKSKKSRANLRREEKKLREAAAVDLVDLAGPAVTDEALRRVAAIQDASWMKGRGAAVLGEPAYQRLLRSVADAGILRVWIVTVGGEDAAFVVGLLLHGQMHYCWTAFRLQFEPLSVGKVLTGWTVRDACAAGAQSFDFGQGDGEYKRFWATDAHDVHRVVAGRGLGGTVVVLFRRAAWRLARVDWIKARYRAVRRWLKGRRGAAPPAPEAAGEPGSAGDDPPAER